MVNNPEGKAMSDEEVDTIEDEDDFIKEVSERFKAQGHSANAIRSFFLANLSIAVPKTLVRLKVDGIERSVVCTPMEHGLEIHWIHPDNSMKLEPSDSDPDGKIIDGIALIHTNTTIQ